MSARASRPGAGNSESLARVALGESQPSMEHDAFAVTGTVYPIFSMNLDAARAVFEGRTTAQGAQNEGDSFARERLARLQVQIDDYIAMLDGTVRNVTQHQSAKLAKQMRDSKEEPVAFQFFRVQQRLMKLAGEHTVDREREMLSKLAALVE
jgi:hypothetical protein